MPSRREILSSLAAMVALLCFALPAAAATWTIEPVPAEPGALAPARLSFDTRGNALLLWDVGPPTHFTGMAQRYVGTSWFPSGNVLNGARSGNVQALPFATLSMLWLSLRVQTAIGVACLEERSLCLAYTYAPIGFSRYAWRGIAPGVTGFVAAANPSGQAIVLFDAGGNGLSTSERLVGRGFGKPTKVSSAGAFAPAVAINARGDRVVAWIRAGRIEARIADAGHGWGSVLDVAKAPGAPNTSLRAAVTPGGSFVLAWDGADVRERRPTRLIAGTAQRRPGKGWRAYPLENATLGMNGSLVAESAKALPLVTVNGAVAVTWTGAVGANSRVGVKAARLTNGGLRSAQVVSGDAANAAVGDAAVGPSGQAAIVWSQFDAQNHVATYAALSPGPGVAFGPADLLTPPGMLGVSGPTVGFQPVTGQAVVIVPIIQGKGGGFTSAVQTP